MMIAWKEEYRIGVPLIDEQHKKLFEIANRAYELLKDDWRTDKYDGAVTILEELRDYALFHFNAEEEYMKGIGYRRFFSHKVEHDDFKEQLTAVDLHTLDTDQEMYLNDILNFVVTWIQNHILKVDKRITDSSSSVSDIAQRAQDIFLAGANCAEAVWQACAEKLGVDPGELELGNRLAGGFGGGAGVEDLCGAVAGGIMALGYLYGRCPEEPRNPKLKSSCQQFCQQVNQEIGSLHCRDLRDPNDRGRCGLIVAKTANIFWEQVKQPRLLDTTSY